MENKDYKFLIFLGLTIYLLSSYILGSLNPFDGSGVFRFIQVGIFLFLSGAYITNKDIF
jgi:hypothetical protein